MAVAALLSLTSDQDVVREHLLLIRTLAALQTRMSVIVHEHCGQLNCLQSEIMRLRAQLILRDTAVAFSGSMSEMPLLADAEPGLQEHAAAADRVICQTACIGHDAYWREGDQCRRTRRMCVLLDPVSEAAGTASLSGV